MTYEKYTGNDYSYQFSELQSENIITSIGDKAFLSNKTIHTMILPETVTHIGNWAFAHMHHLENLTIPCTDLTLGRQVFLDCPNLTAIHVHNDTSANAGLPYFLATTVTVLKNTRLFDPKRAGIAETHAEWMHEYDQALISYLRASDDAGFEPVLYGWFNDEGSDIQLSRHLEERRKYKVYLTFLRLRYPDYLSQETESILYAYLDQHMPYGEQDSVHNAVWEHIINDTYGTDIHYIKILEKAGVLTTKRIAELLISLQPGNPEVISYLLNIQMTDTPNSSGFDAFKL